MSFRRPQLIPIFFIICATLLLGGLGAWQVARLQWKNTLIANIEAAQKQPVLRHLPAELDGVMYRQVELAGTFVHDKTLYFVGQPRGGQSGFQVVTPFILVGGNAVVMVNRGWSPRGKELRNEGVQVVKGVARPLRERRRFVPDNQVASNLWFFEDKEAMAEAVNAKSLLPLVIEQVGSAVAEVYPIPSDGKISLRNDHLGYAITWFTLAFAGIIMFALYHREKPVKDTTQS
jgi:surfeit locus 1 family protein